jgi:hypothetical protein
LGKLAGGGERCSRLLAHDPRARDAKMTKLLEHRLNAHQLADLINFTLGLPRMMYTKTGTGIELTPEISPVVTGTWDRHRSNYVTGWCERQLFIMKILPELRKGPRRAGRPSAGHKEEAAPRELAYFLRTVTQLERLKPVN